MVAASHEVTVLGGVVVSGPDLGTKGTVGWIDAAEAAIAGTLPRRATREVAKRGSI
jgi:hypothetical protein